MVTKKTYSNYQKNLAICNKNWDLNKEAFKTDTSKQDSSMLLETESLFFKFYGTALKNL